MADYAFAGNILVARAILRLDKGCISDVLIRGRDNHGSCRSLTDSQPRRLSSALRSVKAP
jgi:hypothetical protein